MKAIIIKTAPNPGREVLELPGWLVPDTDGLFGIDMRYEADVNAIPPYPAGWVITHLPTGARVSKGDYTSAATSQQAAAIAKRFYDEYKARGWNIYSDKPAMITEPFNSLSKDERTQFWEKVAGWPEKSALPETVSDG